MKKYRIKPIILGNRLPAWQLQHKFYYWWVNTTFKNGKVISTDLKELLDIIKHLNTKL